MCRPIQTKGSDDYENSGNDDGSDEAEHEETEGQQAEGDESNEGGQIPEAGS